MPFSKQFEGPSFLSWCNLEFEQRKIISAVTSLNSVASILYFCWCNLQLDKCEEYYCTLGIPTTDSTSSKSFLCNFGQIFLLINLNWTQCAFQSWDLFLGKYFNYSNITLPNPVGNENSIVLGILRTDCVPALIFQALVEQIWAG